MKTQKTITNQFSSLWGGLRWGFLISILLLSLASSCNKPQPEPEEQLPTGENTMYYYIDGELYIPKASSNGGIYSPAIGYGLCFGDANTFDITTKNLHIQFYNGIQQIGKIILKQSNYDSCQVFDNHALFHTKELWSDGIYHTTWYYTHDGTGEINITYLSANKRQFKGTFEMTVYHENTNVEKHITNGHFNINLDTLE